jgi:hypothetical protein
MKFDDDFLLAAVGELKKRSFFKRFKTETLIKFLPKMSVEQKKKNSVIFLPEDKVAIIGSGTVITKNHAVNQN